jgi:hypothetical protein
LEALAPNRQFGDHSASQILPFDSDTTEKSTNAAFEITSLMVRPSDTQLDTAEALHRDVSDVPPQADFDPFVKSFSVTAQAEPSLVWVAGIEHGTDIVSGKTVEALLSGNLDFDGRKSVQPITEHETTVDTRIGFTDVFRSSTRSSSPGTTIQTSSFPASVTETSKKTNGATENISLSRRLSRRDIGLILGLVFGCSAVFF